ncbi:hypothetical protein VP01_2758g1, partial [Puccinia sorghi]
ISLGTTTSNHFVSAMTRHHQESSRHSRSHPAAIPSKNLSISCVVLQILLADLKDQWNELHEKDEPDSALVAEDNIDKSNNGTHGILHPITLSHFEEPQ